MKSEWECSEMMPEVQMGMRGNDSRNVHGNVLEWCQKSLRECAEMMSNVYAGGNVLEWCQKSVRECAEIMSN